MKTLIDMFRTLREFMDTFEEVRKVAEEPTTTSGGILERYEAVRKNNADYF